jgi:hypothetical protein
MKLRCIAWAAALAFGAYFAGPAVADYRTPPVILPVGCTLG